jgi:hypothetical protein
MEHLYAEMSNHDDSIDHAAALPSAWAKAHEEFAQDLTTAEQLVYEKASIDTIISDVKIADARLKASKYDPNVFCISSNMRIFRSKRFLDKISPFVKTVQGYGSALDVFSNICPLVMAPLWGGIRVILFVGWNFNPASISY